MLAQSETERPPDLERNSRGYFTAIALFMQSYVRYHTETKDFIRARTRWHCRLTRRTGVNSRLTGVDGRLTGVHGKTGVDGRLTGMLLITNHNRRSEVGAIPVFRLGARLICMSLTEIKLRHCASMILKWNSMKSILIFLVTLLWKVMIVEHPRLVKQWFFHRLLAFSIDAVEISRLTRLLQLLFSYLSVLELRDVEI